MLKTNSKKALENIRAYILDNADDTNFGGDCEFTDWKQAARFVYSCFKTEKSGEYYDRMPEHDVFEEWASGLPSSFDFCYWCNRPAVDDLGAILEESEEEKARFSETAACKLLTTLIYNQIKKAVA